MGECFRGSSKKPTHACVLHDMLQQRMQCGWKEGRARGAINYELDMLLDGAGPGEPISFIPSGKADYGEKFRPSFPRQT